MKIDTPSNVIIRDESTNIISCTAKVKKTCRGLGYEYFKSMQQNKDNVAQIIADTGEIDTYGALLERVVRTALHLAERNLAKDDVVCLSSYGQLNHTVPFLACLFLGVPVASLDPSFNVSDAAHLIKLVKPKIFFIVPEVLDVITAAMGIAKVEAEIVVYGEKVDTERFTPFNTFLEKHPEENEFRPVEIKDASETAVIFFSSGTTGLPKGICCSHKAVYHQGVLLGYQGKIYSHSIILLFSTLYWVSAVLTFSAAVVNGAARLVCKKFNPKNTWHILDKYKPTFVFLAPIQAYEMIATGRPEGIDTTSVNGLTIGGAHMNKSKMLELRDLLPGTFVSSGYGCTELSGIVICFDITRTQDKLYLHYKPESVGRPIPGLEYKLVNVETENTCGPHERGELRVRSEFVLNGYYHQDSSSAFDKEGWLRTGDIMYYDEDFCFFVEDRIKEMLKYRSWHVPPAALEMVIQLHPAVKQCAVIGIPHEIDGDHPLAVIQLEKAFEGVVTEDEFQDFVAERVNDTHKLRGGVKFIEALPLTPSGKVKKQELRNMVLRGDL